MQFTASRQVAPLANQESTRGKAAKSGLIAFAFFVVCGIFVVVLDRPPQPLPEQAPLSVFSAQRAIKHLAAISRAPHPIHSSEHDAVRDYIVRTLQDLGFTPQIQKFADVHASDQAVGPLENIMCRLPGSTREKAVLLVAHYDSVRAGPGASDDGVAVAAFLESARILKSLPQLKRDVIFLFTDGEEPGLLGARAFVAEHPWVHDVAFVLNFEARGNSGPSIMFETTDENGWLISNFGQSASHPVANSITYEIYKRLPNDTDLTVFRHAGYSGLNFAFIGGLEYYHTPNDSIQNVDLGSLQHHGDYVLELTKQFGNAASDDPKQPNVAYFDVLGWVLVRYGQSTAIFLLGLTSVLVAVMAYLGLRKKHLRIGASLLGLIFMFLGVVVAIVAAGAISSLTFALQKQFPMIRAGLWYHSELYILAFSTVGLAGATAFYSLVSKWVSSENLTFGALLGWFVLAIAVTIYFPGATYLFVWPLLFSLLGWIVVFALRDISAGARSVLLALSGLPAILLVVPLIHKIFFAFASGSAFIVSALLGLLLALLIGQFAPERMPRRWRLPLLLAVAGAGLFVTAITVSAVDKGHAQPSGAFMNMQR
jgi:hypothetical protein